MCEKLSRARRGQNEFRARLKDGKRRNCHRTCTFSLAIWRLFLFLARSKRKSIYELKFIANFRTNICVYKQLYRSNRFASSKCYSNQKEEMEEREKQQQQKVSKTNLLRSITTAIVIIIGLQFYYFQLNRKKLFFMIQFLIISCCIRQIVLVNYGLCMVARGQSYTHTDHCILTHVSRVLLVVHTELYFDSVRHMAFAMLCAYRSLRPVKHE